MEIRHTFVCAALEDDETFRVVTFEGTEQVSQPFRFEIDLASREPEVPFENVINRPATLTMARGDDAPIEINGIVVDLVQSDRVEAPDGAWYLYRAVLMPRMQRLAFSNRSRIFQHRTVQEIVTDVLSDAAVALDWNLKAHYEPREYTTQYKETDLNFVQRLLEFEGIRYHVRHQDRQDIVVLSDDAQTAPEVDEGRAFPYTREGAPHTEAVLGLTARRSLVTGGVEVKDFSYQNPADALFASLNPEAAATTGIHSDSMIHVSTQGDVDRLAQVRQEELASSQLTLTGTSNSYRLRTGYRFDLEGHYRGDFNQSYLVTRVVHRGATTGIGFGETGTEAGYQCEFACVPASTPYRPPRVTPVPKLPGVLTATVESAGGDYAPVDDAGRYRIRFPFDLGDEDEAQASKPVRLAQPYTGPGYGQHFPVHGGTEMVVACVDGDVDRVIGLSTVPNAANPSPVTAANKTQNVVKTAASNLFELGDTKGKERITLSTPYKATTLELGSKGNADGAGLTTAGEVKVHGANSVSVTAWKTLEDSTFQQIFKIMLSGAKLLAGQAKSRHFKAPDAPFKDRADRLGKLLKLREGVAKGAAAFDKGAKGEGDLSKSFSGDAGAIAGTGGRVMAAFGEGDSIDRGVALLEIALDDQGTRYRDKAVSEARAKGAKPPDPQTLAKLIETTAAESAAPDAVKLGASVFTGLPAGVSITAPGNVEVSTPSKFSVDAVQGASVMAGLDVELGSLKDIGLHSRMAVNIFGHHTGVKVASGKGRIDIGADNNSIGIKAEKNIDIHAKMNVNVDADEQLTGMAKSIDVFASDEIKVKAGTYINIDADEPLSATAKAVQILAADGVEVKAGTHTKIEAAEQLSLVCGKAEIVLTSDGTVTLKGKKLVRKFSDSTKESGRSIALN